MLSFLNFVDGGVFLHRRIAALLLSGVLVLGASGCASMLNRSYQSVAPHDKQPNAESDSSAIRVEDYPELVNAILYLVSQGETEGTIRLHSYKRDVEKDLTAACDEVSHEDPLGAYAVSGIKHSLKFIVSYYEATVNISYSRTAEQIANARKASPVTGSGAIRNELRDGLTAFASEIIMRVNYFNEEAAYVEDMVERAYYDNPAAALGMPKVEVNLYPDSGTQRLVEVVLTYPEAGETLRKKSAEALAAADALAAPLVKSLKGEAILPPLYAALRAKCPETGGSTPYDALVKGKANSEGMALAFKLLCDIAGIECTVVEGTDGDGTRHFWTIVAAADGHRHIDPFLEDSLILTDAELAARGYTWSGEDYPPCGAPEPEENQKNLA